MSSEPQNLTEARSLVERIQARARAAGHEYFPSPPEEPDPRSCCERGCEYCVFVVYYKALQEWHQEALLLLE